MIIALYDSTIAEGAQGTQAVPMFEGMRQRAGRPSAARGRRHKVPDDIRARLPLAAIEQVTFFKRDELTTDLICCEVEADGKVWFFHEEAEGWDLLLRYLEELPGFRTDWLASVIQPPFAATEVIAFSR